MDPEIIRKDLLDDQHYVVIAPWSAANYILTGKNIKKRLDQRTWTFICRSGAFRKATPEEVVLYGK